MVFQSSVITLEWNRNNLILRRGASSLVIDAEKVQNLRTQENEQSFIEYFRTTALQNREARRVFEAWERKENTLLAKIYAEVTS